ncbi:hypothetical protein DAEQUDRAFT_767725 [Daedalea quercina L-15889]|uniref:Nucleoporin n=1 Tax=Daedalea quercina L-15889 TaxID=1314783 RepID=A0A165NB77_9APHY|nr:hypothetical protein DAEQUDRAFT_767725 [Daedalea quercina L-15889]
MASAARLRTLLLSAFSPRGLENGEQEFFEELMAHKPLLTNLYDVGPRNPQEQRELESGKITVNGRPHAVNPDFARQALFISQQLDVSERHVASILQYVMAENPNVPMEQCIETTVLEFHTRRRHLADCIRYIFEAAELTEAGNVPALYVRLETFVRQQLLPPLRGSGGGLSFAMKIFQEIHNLGNVLSKTQVARQNAKSNTVAPAQGTQASLGADILTARCDSLKYERRTLAIALYFMGRMGYLGPNEVSKLVDWLHVNPRHPMTFYILPTVLAAFDIVRPDSNGGATRKYIASDKGLMTYMKKKMDSGTEWNEPGLKATILLKWALFLADMRHRDSSLENAEGFRAEEIETMIWNAVQGDCFTYLMRTIARLQNHAAFPPTLFASNLLAQVEQDPSLELPSEEFKPAILEACELLIRSMINQASSELRKIKQRQEDLLLAGARTGQARAFRGSHAQPSVRFAPASSEADRPGTPPRNDMAVLFSLIGLLYSMLPPERALHFWGGGSVPEGRRSTYTETVEATSGKLPAFLNWAVWSTQPRDVDMLTALYDMLGGLATGQQCSELAYNFLARGGGDVVPGSTLASSSTTHLAGGPAVSWNAIFGLLDSWVTAGSIPRNNQPAPNSMPGLQPSFGASQQWQTPQPQLPPSQLPFTPQDVLLAQAFLRLLATVVTHSVAVRITISGHARFRAIPTLISLVPLGIPLELKGSIFETLAAFCEAGAGNAGAEICRSVWVLMERMEVINVRANTGFSGSLAAVKGVEVELEQVEAIHKMYPATISFLKLLSTLMHTPKGVPIRERIADAEPINTIPENLGQPYRQPGIGPFSSFVIDNVFSRINSREYLRPSDRWQMNDLCLCFIEHCLASYDLESLVASSDELQPKGEALVQLLVHPGFDIIKRVLTTSSLQASILSYLVEGLDGLDRGFAEEEYYFRTTIVRVLRIVHRVLEIQDIFLDVFLPLLADLNDPNIGDVPHASYFTRFDQVLSYAPEHVPAVAAYVAYPAHPELMFLSVKILTALAASSSFSQLALLIDRSAESDRILDGFVTILDSDVLEDVDAAETMTELSTGAGAPAVDEPSDALLQAIRLAVLDFFIRNTHQNRPYPNIAHRLLFGSSTANNQIQDPHALGARRSCVHSILDLLNSGVPRLSGKGRERRQTVATDALFVVLPALAERCYHVIYELCKHPRTSDSTMRYLRTREDFFARHLASIPFKVPAMEHDPFVEVMYNDGSRIITTVPNLAAFLQLRSWIMNLIALELHVLVTKGHHKTVAELLELLFGNEGGYVESGADDWDVFKPFHEVGQSHLRMIEFLQSLDFDWSDSVAVQPVELEFFGQLNLQSCIRTNEDGCEIVDRTALLSVLASARRALHAQSRIVTPTHLQQLATETDYILQSCAVENHRRQVQFATAGAFEAWRRLLDMSLTKCFHRLPSDRREDMLFDLLHVMPLTMRSANTQESTAILLAEAMLSAITKLREDRHHQVILRSAGGDVEAGSLPTERLHSLLRSILECIVDNGRVELVRGNLYASLVNYLHLVMSSEGGPNLEAPDLDASFTSPFSPDGISRNDGLAVGPPRPRLTHISGTLSILKSAMERLVVVVSRDAIDGTEVWKTVAFMLLDSLVRLARWEKHTPTVLQALTRHGFLAGFVGGLKESDLRLQAVLKPDPDDLNTLYVYEAKMSLLIRMSQSRQGAERLLECRAISVLADREYLDARPEADQAFMDNDSFLPSAVQRYHQLFLPALQLVSGILVTLGHRHMTAVNQALQFLSSHRDTLIILLKNEVDELSLAVIDEMRLTVSLCANVFHLVPKTELLSSSGFGGIHAAISSLATTCLGNTHWSDAVKPQGDAELRDAGTTSPAFGTETKFRYAVHHRERMLRRALTAYLGTASEFTEPDITLVISPIVTTPREERTSRFLATVPTVGDAIEALNHLCDDLSSSLKRIADISAELNSKAYIRVENIEDIIPLSDPALLDNLDMRQRQSLIARELTRWRAEANRRAHITLSSLEMLLLLLWRHLDFYCEGRHINNPDLKGSISHMMRFASSPDVETLKIEAARKIVPVFHRLENLDLTEGILGKDWQSYGNYIEIMTRRIKDTTGLEDEPEAGQEGDVSFS